MKIKSYNGKISTSFHNNKISKEGSQFICSSVFWSILFLEQTKIIIQKCFQKKVNMLLKKKWFLSILLMIKKFLLILIGKILLKKIEKILIKLLKPLHSFLHVYKRVQTCFLFIFTTQHIHTLEYHMYQFILLLTWLPVRDFA